MIDQIKEFEALILKVFEEKTKNISSIKFEKINSIDPDRDHYNIIVGVDNQYFAFRNIKHIFREYLNYYPDRYIKDLLDYYVEEIVMDIARKIYLRG